MKKPEEKEEKINIENLKKQLEECQRQKEEYLESWKRERADFLNYKKEEIERIGKFTEYINEELILKFLPILDNLDIGEKKIPENLKQDKNIEGILQIKIQILDFLKTQNLKEIKCLGQKFDPHFHEAIEEIEDKEKEKGIIVEEIKKGYTLHSKVIRPAIVKITK